VQNGKISSILGKDIDLKIFAFVAYVPDTSLAFFQKNLDI
jgi:hypothetical protein